VRSERNVPAGVEFLIVTQWSSLEAIRSFAGSNAERAVVPENVREMMLEYEHTVRHYEIAE
jgi:heme-degrading monooxygenase HmoA